MEYCQEVCSYSPLLDNVDLVAVKVCFFFDNAESARFCQVQGLFPLHKDKLLPVERHGVLWVKGRFENKDKKGLGGGSAKEDDPFFYLDHHQQHTSSTHYTHTHTPTHSTFHDNTKLASIGSHRCCCTCCSCTYVFQYSTLYQ